VKFVSIKTVGKFFGTGAVMLALTAHAELSLPGVFGDNMVLQREQAVPVWGVGRAGGKSDGAFCVARNCGTEFV